MLFIMLHILIYIVIAKLFCLLPSTDAAIVLVFSHIFKKWGSNFFRYMYVRNIQCSFVVTSLFYQRYLN